MKVFQKGFTLIELMIVVAIIGILAAIAIPAYQDYTIRAQVSEGLTLASDIKAGVAEYSAQVGNWPVNLAEAGLGSVAAAIDKQGRYVDTIDIDPAGGTIVVTYGRDANTKITGQILSIQPYVNVNGDVLWRCGKSDAPVNGNPVLGTTTSADTAGITTLNDKHMPASCRAGFGGN